MIRCKCCGKVIHGWYWWRHFYDDIEFYCEDCASCMVDEHSNNGLLSGYEEEEQ